MEHFWNTGDYWSSDESISNEENINLWTNKKIFTLVYHRDIFGGFQSKSKREELKCDISG